MWPVGSHRWKPARALGCDPATGHDTSICRTSIAVQSGGGGMQAVSSPHFASAQLGSLRGAFRFPGGVNPLQLRDSRADGKVQPVVPESPVITRGPAILLRRRAALCSLDPAGRSLPAHFRHPCHPFAVGLLNPVLKRSAFGLIKWEKPIFLARPFLAPTLIQLGCSQFVRHLSGGRQQRLESCGFPKVSGSCTKFRSIFDAVWAWQSEWSQAEDAFEVSEEYLDFLPSVRRGLIQVDPLHCPANSRTISYFLRWIAPAFVFGVNWLLMGTQCGRVSTNDICGIANPAHSGLNRNGCAACASSLCLSERYGGRFHHPL